MNDPYKTLGVAKTATEAEIKKAFRALAKKHHPDAHPGDEKAKQRFQELSAAYDVVGDKVKRAKFDAGAWPASSERNVSTQSLTCRQTSRIARSASTDRSSCRSP